MTTNGDAGAIWFRFLRAKTADELCIGQAFVAWDFRDGDEEDGVGGVDAIVGEALGKLSKFVGSGAEPDVAGGGICKEVLVFHRFARMGVGDGSCGVRLRTEVVAWFKGRRGCRGWCR